MEAVPELGRRRSMWFLWLLSGLIAAWAIWLASAGSGPRVNVNVVQLENATDTEQKWIEVRLEFTRRGRAPNSS